MALVSEISNRSINDESGTQTCGKVASFPEPGKGVAGGAGG